MEGLESQIKKARFWDSEVRQEGLVWTALWDEPYKAETVPALLNHCDEVYVAAYAIKASAPRCKSSEAAFDIVDEVLQGNVIERCFLYERATDAVLHEGLDPQSLYELIDSSAETDAPQVSSPPPRRLMKRRSVSARDLGSFLGATPDSPETALSHLTPDKDESPMLGQSQSAPTAQEAAAVALRLSCVSLSVALRRIGSLLAAGSALASKDWKAAEVHKRSPTPCARSPGGRLRTLSDASASASEEGTEICSLRRNSDASETEGVLFKRR
eukprot:TRINITY_DN81148_c0_g1_i1.p1 TRINITY_DN81148_c0_g1~~TRINITY_DN81148_c0_g1_i1.p1  ORF type:complete len:311 (+),score=56.08 TRINITY_DN81148_c0_g1_i1:121-933(+)